MSRKRVALGAAAALAIATIGGYEGLRTKTYYDAVHIPTYCYGETEGAKMGLSYTIPQCKALLGGRLEEFNAMVDSCVKVTMSVPRRVSAISLAYNIGGGAFCKSTFVKRLNAGDPKACDAILLYNRAGGRVLPGLDRRRHEERLLCLQ